MNRLTPSPEISTKLYSEDKCKIPINNDIEIRFALHTLFAIKADLIPENNQKKSMANSTVVHRYKLWNAGPSITNRTYNFTVSLPKKHNSREEQVVIEPNLKMSCNPISKIRIRPEGCNNDDKKTDPTVTEFIHYFCSGEKGWNPNTEYQLKINMDFKTNDIPNTKDGKLPDKFFFANVC